MKAFAKSSLGWLCGGLALLVLYNLWNNAGFVKITLHEGHLYGVPVDILTQGSRVTLLSSRPQILPSEDRDVADRSRRAAACPTAAPA